MAQETYIPNVDLASGSTKDKIIYIILNESPINTKRIHFVLKKNHAVSISYQGVHKLVKQLVEQGILSEDGFKYQINLKWIHLMKQLVVNLEKKEKSESHKAQHIKINDNMETILVNNLNEAETYFFKFREEYFSSIERFEEKDRILCLHAPHLYIALMSPTKEYEFMDRLLKSKTKHYTLSKGNTIVDKWIMRFYNSKEGNPYRVKAGANCSSINEVWVYPDKLIEVFFSEKFWKFYDTLYRSIKKIEDINYSTIIEKLYLLKDEPFRIIVHKDPSLIKIAREETLKQFGIYPDKKDSIRLPPISSIEMDSVNKKRFSEMDDSYNAYSPYYKNFITALANKAEKDQSKLLLDYVLKRIGSRAGIRGYILRKFLELNGVEWQSYIDLLGMVELHLASMYCFNAGADNKTSFKFDKKIFYSCKDQIRKKVFEEVKAKYGKDVENVFRDTDLRCYSGLVLDTIINTHKNQGANSKALLDAIRNNYNYYNYGIEVQIIEKAFDEYIRDIAKIKPLVFERTYAINAIMIANLARIAFLVSGSKKKSIFDSLYAYGKYCGLSNMIINDIQDFSLDFVDTKVSTREKEKTDVFSDMKNGYITWVIKYGLISEYESVRNMTEKLLGRHNKYDEMDELRKAYVKHGIFRKAFVDASAYATLAVMEMNKISSVENIENVNMLKDLVVTSAIGSKYVKLMEKRYGENIRLDLKSQKKLKNYIYTHSDSESKLLAMSLYDELFTV